MTDDLEIHISDNKVQAGAGSIPIHWCLSKRLIAKLKEMKVKDPHLLLAIYPSGKPQKQRRKLFPLNEMMGYIDFNHPGENTIFGMIIWSVPNGDFDTSYPKDYLLASSHHYYEKVSNGSYIHSIFSDENVSDKTFCRNLINDYTISFDEPKIINNKIKANVPEDCFAKEPPEWEQTWVNWMHTSPPIDQCEYRKRRLFAYSIQPIILAVLMFVRCVLALIGMLGLCRGIDFSPIYKPLSSATAEVLENSQPIYDKLPKPVIWIITPLLPLFYPIITGLACIWLPLTTAILVPFALSIIISVSMLIIFAILGLDFKPSPKKEKGKTWYDDDELTSLLICQPGRHFYNVKNLPKKHRTIKLRFEGFKSKVCKPFSG